MSQHDYNIANAGGAAVRADINNALLAVQSLNSGATAPTATKPYMPWYDTATGALKMRNAADTGWVSMGEAIAGNGQLAGLRNRIINGNMAVSQRNGATATAVGSTAAAAYNVDRWQAFRTAGAVGATSQGQQLTGLTGGPSLFTKVQRNNADASTAVIYLATSLETGNIRDLQGKTVTLSFWLATVGAATTNGVVAAINQGTGSDGNFFAGFTGPTAVVTSGALSAASWTKFSITGTVASNATQLGVVFSWTPTGTAGASDYFGVTGVQLELGSVATPFEERPYQLEELLCYRYFELVSGIAKTTANFGIAMKVTKRAIPTVALVSLAAGTGFGCVAVDRNSLYQSVANSLDAAFGVSAAAEL